LPAIVQKMSVDQQSDLGRNAHKRGCLHLPNRAREKFIEERRLGALATIFYTCQTIPGTFGESVPGVHPRSKYTARRSDCLTDLHSSLIETFATRCVGNMWHGLFRTLRNRRWGDRTAGVLIPANVAKIDHQGVCAFILHLAELQRNIKFSRAYLGAYAGI
jgi:hypothetical protein